MKKWSLFIATLSLLAFRFPVKVEDWLLQREKKGIKVFTRHSKWGKLKDSKAVMLLHAKLEDVVQLITDYKSYPLWMPRCKKARILAHISDDEFIGYLCYDSPWPVADRDCVSRVKIIREPQTGSVTILQTSEPHYIKEEDGVVRLQQMTGRWKVTAKGDAVEVLNEYSTNPGGNLPDWLVNTQSVENPFEMFTVIQERMAAQKH
ncbi:MAG: START domain-containing protein [Chitinophagales bacterium]